MTMAHTQHALAAHDAQSFVEHDRLDANDRLLGEGEISRQKT